MKKYNYKEFSSCYSSNDSLLILQNVDRIILKNNFIIFPNLENIRFKITPKYLEVYYGYSIKYGDVLYNPKIVYTQNRIFTKYIPTKNMKYPEAGYMLRISKDNIIKEEVLIKSVTIASNGMFIELCSPLKSSQYDIDMSVVSYYSLSEIGNLYNNNVIYLNFIIDAIPLKIKYNKIKKILMIGGQTYD